MGGEPYQNTHPTKDGMGEEISMSEAFNSEVSSAQHYHGHGGYTGTIAEKDGYEDITDKIPPTVSTSEQLIRWMELMDDGRSKWDSSLAAKWEGYYYFVGWASS